MTQTRIHPTNDGSGDGILELPDAIMTALGWSISDQVSIELLPDGTIAMTRSGQTEPTSEA